MPWILFSSLSNRHLAIVVERNDFAPVESARISALADAIHLGFVVPFLHGIIGDLDSISLSRSRD